jgi:hypothetical protein
VEIEPVRWEPDPAPGERPDIVPDTIYRDLQIPGLVGTEDTVTAGAGAWVSVAAAVEDGGIDTGPLAFPGGDAGGSIMRSNIGMCPRLRYICRRKAMLRRSWLN